MDREALLSALGGLLGDDRPTVFVVEDAHWADDATLDVLRWLCVGWSTTAALVVLTYRSTDVDARASAAAPARRRTSLDRAPHRAPRARARGRRLAGAAAGRDVDAEALARVTGGNPFFVTEVLADARADIPSSVVDAVIARLHALPVDTVKALLICSVIPGSIDWSWRPPCSAMCTSSTRPSVAACSSPTVRASGSATSWRAAPSRDRSPTCCASRTTAGCSTQLVALDAPSVRSSTTQSAPGTSTQLLEHGVRGGTGGGGDHGARRQAAEHFAVVLDHADRLETGEEAAAPAGHAYELFLLNELADRPRPRRGRAAARRGVADSLVLAEMLATLIPVARLFDLGDGAPPTWAGGRSSCSATTRRPSWRPPPASTSPATSSWPTSTRRPPSGPSAGSPPPRRAGRKDLESLCLMYRATSKGWLGDPGGEADLRVPAIERAEGLGAWDYAARAATTWSACCSGRPGWPRCRLGSTAR